jgi:hypothetical protein
VAGIFDSRCCWFSFLASWARTAESDKMMNNSETMRRVFLALSVFSPGLHPGVSLGEHCSRGGSIRPRKKRQATRFVCDYVWWGNPCPFCHPERSEGSGLGCGRGLDAREILPAGPRCFAQHDRTSLRPHEVQLHTTLRVRPVSCRVRPSPKPTGFEAATRSREVSSHTTLPQR